MNDPRIINPSPAGRGAYEVPQMGGRSPLMLLLIILWLIVIVGIVAGQFIFR